MAEQSTTGGNPAGRIHFVDHHPPEANMADEVLAGLAETPKRIAPKYFYDARGSQLFDAITELPEYYPTRTETALLRAHAGEVARLAGDGAFLIEYGSGSSIKVQLLLDALQPAGYMPIDISRDHLGAAARAVAERHSWLDVYPTCADYSHRVPLPAAVAGLQVMAFFPGSSIGNFSPAAGGSFLANVAATIGAGGYLLIGVDRKKDVAVLERAYNDAAGVTAEFNLNVIDHINAALAGSVRRAAFAHEARYNDDAGRIEMHLHCLHTHVAEVAGQRVAFAAGERIHTENSYKYHPHEFQSLAERSGFAVERHWSDAAGWFSVFLCRAVAPPSV